MPGIKWTSIDFEIFWNTLRSSLANKSETLSDENSILDANFVMLFSEIIIEWSMSCPRPHPQAFLNLFNSVIYLPYNLMQFKFSQIFHHFWKTMIKLNSNPILRWFDYHFFFICTCGAMLCFFAEYTGCFVIVCCELGAMFYILCTTRSELNLWYYLKYMVI